MLMSLNKGETADHGCHCWGKMAVRMRNVMAIPWSWCVCFSAVLTALKILIEISIVRSKLIKFIIKKM